MNADIVKVLLRAKHHAAAFAAEVCVVFCVWTFSTVLQGPAAEAQLAAAGPGPRITLSAAEVETGGILIVRMDCRRMPASARELVGFFGDQAAFLFPHPAEAKGVYAGIVGIALAARPGPAALKVEWSDGAQRRSTSADFVIRHGSCGEETLKVDPRHVRPEYVRGLERYIRAGQIDKVVAMYVASVVPHPARLVEEMRRVCKPDGELYVVNHFHRGGSLVGRIERRIAPLSRLMGFRPDLSCDDFIRDSRLAVIEQMPVNLFGYWTLLRARNDKHAAFS